MAENKTYRLGDLIELCDEQNTEGKYTVDDVKGISIEKKFIETKADMSGVSLIPYILVKPGCFAYVTVTSRNGEKITLAHNTTANTYIVSSSYVVFKINSANVINSDYLFMFFNRPEFDRYARFNSWGSARETFSWEDMCDMQITLPPLAVQQKAVAVYNALKANLAAYEQGLDDLKLVCDGFIDTVKNKATPMSGVAYYRVGDLIEICDERNTDGKYTLDDVRGISIEKKFIQTKADMKDVSLTPYIVVKPDSFAYVTVTSRNGEKITLAHNDSDDTYIVSSSYIVFRVVHQELILSDYLSLFFNRSEFDHYARYCSWGSARETFDWTEMCDVQIPLPSLEVQQSIVNMYKCYTERRRIAEELKTKIKTICPILIKGSLENM